MKDADKSSTSQPLPPVALVNSNANRKDATSTVSSNLTSRKTPEVSSTNLNQAICDQMTAGTLLLKDTERNALYKTYDEGFFVLSNNEHYDKKK